jgi:MycE methyltransferase N-terminal
VELDRDKVLEHVLWLADRTWPEPIEAVDVREVAALVLDEVLDRAALFDSPAAPVTVQFDLGVTAERLGYVVTVGPDRRAVQPGWAAEPAVTVRQDLVELVHAVYGSSGADFDATREVFVLNEPGTETESDDDPWLRQRRAAVLAAGQVVSACSPHRPDLGALARRFGSDKWGDQWYTRHYERHFARFRDRRVRLLEIGVGGFEAPAAGGESLRMWKYYFRRGLIYGLDIFDKSALDELRVRTVRGDQSDPEFLSELAGRIGPLDIVIDDGSHLSDHVVASFLALFPRMRPGGVYVVEDLQTSYWPGWNSNRSDLNDPATSVGFLKTLVDGLHHQDQLRAGPYEPSVIELGVTAVHFYRNIVYIEKGLNTEQTAPSWVRRHSNDMELSPKGSMRMVAGEAAG